MTKRSQTSTALLVGAGAASAVCCGVMLSKVFRSTSSDSALPLEVRRQRLTEAEDRFGSMFAQVPVISGADALKLLDDQPDRYVIVDVRNADEQKVSMLPGQVLTSDQYKAQQDNLKDVTAICYCTVGFRSSQFASSLLAEGRQALNLRGGIIGWTHEGLPLVCGTNRQQPTRKVHTYGQRWAVQADGYQPVYYSHSYFVMLRDGVKALGKALIGG